MKIRDSVELMLQEMASHRRARMRIGVHRYPSHILGVLATSALVAPILRFHGTWYLESLCFLIDAQGENFLDPQALSKERTVHYYDNYFDVNNAPRLLNLPTADQTLAESLFGPNRSAVGAAARYPQRDFLVRCMYDISRLLQSNDVVGQFYRSRAFKEYRHGGRFGRLTK